MSIRKVIKELALEELSSDVANDILAMNGDIEMTPKELLSELTRLGHNLDEIMATGLFDGVNGSTSLDAPENKAKPVSFYQQLVTRHLDA